MLYNMAIEYLGLEPVSKLPEHLYPYAIQSTRKYEVDDNIIPESYINIYDSYEHLMPYMSNNDRVSSLVHVLLSPYTKYAQYWAMYKIDRKYKKYFFGQKQYKRNMRKSKVDTLDYLIPIICIVGEDYMTETLKGMINNMEYEEVKNLVRDSCITKKYVEVCTLLGMIWDTSQMDDVLNIKHPFDTLVTLSKLDPNRSISCKGVTQDFSSWIRYLSVNEDECLNFFRHVNKNEVL